MPQDGNSSTSQSNDTHDVEMIDDDISVITPKTHPPGEFSNLKYMLLLIRIIYLYLI